MQGRRDGQERKGLRLQPRSAQGCGFTIWKRVADHKLTKKQIHAVIGDGKTRLIKGLKGRFGRNFDARLTWDSQWTVAFELPEPRPSLTGIDEI